MSDATYISEPAAMRILVQEGDFTPCQAKAVLSHSLKQSALGATYYPMAYVYKRAEQNAARAEICAFDIPNQ